MKSPLCDRYRIEFPLFAFTHCRDVAAAVSRAGGFGVYGGARIGSDRLKVDLDWIDAHVGGKPYGVDLAIPENMAMKGEKEQDSETLYAKIPEQHKRFVEQLLVKHGVNPQTPVAADERHRVSQFLDEAERMVDESLRHPIRLIVNALGRPPQFMVERARRHDVPVGALVGAKEHVIKQLEAGVDLLIAQGGEAAAHCGEISTMVLVPEVVRAVEAIRHVPVLAAGGIVTGRQMAAAMAMGAAGAWTGSVWLTTVESDVSAVLRAKFLAASSRDTVRSRAMSGKTARQLRSAWSEAWEGPDSPGMLPMPLQYVLTERAFQRATKAAETGNLQAARIVSGAIGQGVGLMETVHSCRGIVQEFMEDFAEALDRMRQLADES
jgi:NAD(P)H-dependent flavin oxidoreductase YrpB (nitropropane dioxygenase family)